DLIDSAAFAAAEYRLDWLVRDILVAGQPAVLGGQFKSLKTTILIDLVLSLGAGPDAVAARPGDDPGPRGVLWHFRGGPGRPGSPATPAPRRSRSPRNGPAAPRGSCWAAPASCGASACRGWAAATTWAGWRPWSATTAWGSSPSTRCTCACSPGRPA